MGLDGRGVETKFCPGLHGLKWQLLLCFLAATCEAFFFPGLVPITYCEEGNPNTYCKVRSPGQKRALEGRGAEDTGWSQTHYLGMTPYFFLVLSSQHLYYFYYPLPFPRDQFCPCSGPAAYSILAS